MILQLYPKHELPHTMKKRHAKLREVALIWGTHCLYIKGEKND